MKKHLLKVFSLLTIISIAGLIYFYKLNSIPNGFYVDEATVAYNAKSILETGKDEYGYSYPIFFRLLGSYTPSVFIYLSSVLIKFFGNQPIVFRSISAISSLISVFVFFMLVKKMRLFKSEISYYAITLFYAISPWLIFNARIGYETTMAFLVFTYGMYFLFLSHEKTKYLISSVVLLSLSTYVSHNQRFLAPLILTVFIIVFKKRLLMKSNYKYIIYAIIAGIIINLPNLTLLTTNAFWIKSSQFDLNNFWTILSYLSPKTLFWENPDIDLQHTIPKLSLFYDWMVILYAFGMYVLAKNIKEYKYKFIALYLLVTLIPAIFSSHFVSEQRALAAIIPLSIIIGIGLDEITNKLKPIFTVSIVFLLTIYSLITFYSSYFVLLPKERFEAWNYGYDQIANYIEQNPGEKLLIDNTRNPRSYVLLLYYLNYPPNIYQKEVNSFYRDNYYEAPPPATEYNFGNVTVGQIDWKKNQPRGLVVIGDQLSISVSQAKEHSLTKVSEVKGPTGEVLFLIFKKV